MIKKLLILSLLCSSLAFVPSIAKAAPHAPGANIKTSDGTIWMIMANNMRRAYTSAGAFLSYGTNSFASVVDASTEDLTLPVDALIPPQDGKVICSDRSPDKGTCYLISGHKKSGFTSSNVFTGLGFKFNRSNIGDVSFLSANSLIESSTSPHLPGVLINNNGTIQLVGTTGLLGIPNVSTFQSWGYTFEDVVPANTADKAMVQTGVMLPKVNGYLSPFDIIGNTNTYCSLIKTEFDSYYLKLQMVTENAFAVKNGYYPDLIIGEVAYQQFLAQKDSYYSKISQLTTSANQLSVTSFASLEAISQKQNFLNGANDYQNAFNLRLAGWQSFNDNPNSITNLNNAEALFRLADSKAATGQQSLTNALTNGLNIYKEYDKLKIQNNCN